MSDQCQQACGERMARHRALALVTDQILLFDPLPSMPSGRALTSRPSIAEKFSSWAPRLKTAVIVPAASIYDSCWQSGFLSE